MDFLAKIEVFLMKVIIYKYKINKLNKNNYKNKINKVKILKKIKCIKMMNKYVQMSNKSVCPS